MANREYFPALALKQAVRRSDTGNLALMNCHSLLQRVPVQQVLDSFPNSVPDRKTFETTDLQQLVGPHGGRLA